LLSRRCTLKCHIYVNCRRFSLETLPELQPLKFATSLFSVKLPIKLLKLPKLVYSINMLQGSAATHFKYCAQSYYRNCCQFSAKSVGERISKYLAKMWTRVSSGFYTVGQKNKQFSTDCPYCHSQVIICNKVNIVITILTMRRIMTSLLKCAEHKYSYSLTHSCKIGY